MRGQSSLKSSIGADSFVLNPTILAFETLDADIQHIREVLRWARLRIENRPSGMRVRVPAIAHARRRTGQRGAVRGGAGRGSAGRGRTGQRGAVRGGAARAAKATKVVGG
ncbi:hypothetical protein GCM10009834_28480 [Streptomonospora arabica]